MKLNTLKKNKEFNYVYRRGKAVHRRLFTLIYVPSRYGGIRAGFSVSKKVGNAVVRNRARRRMKEALITQLPQFTGHYSLVFIARPIMADAAFADIVVQMNSALKMAGIQQKVRDEKSVDRDH